jgi:hypothetical protein
MEQYIVIPFLNFEYVKAVVQEETVEQGVIGTDPLTTQPAMVILTLKEDLDDNQKAEIPYSIRDADFIAAFQRQNPEYWKAPENENGEGVTEEDLEPLTDEEREALQNEINESNGQ